jgi:hypothetical protein
MSVSLGLKIAILGNRKVECRKSTAENRIEQTASGLVNELVDKDAGPSPLIRIDYQPYMHRTAEKTNCDRSSSTENQVGDRISTPLPTS